MSRAEQSFWDRLRENARCIVEKDYADLKKQTCSPDYCLLESDKDLMRMRQGLLEEFNRDWERLNRDGFRSRVLALVTVLLAGPKNQ